MPKSLEGKGVSCAVVGSVGPVTCGAFPKAYLELQEASVALNDLNKARFWTEFRPKFLRLTSRNLAENL